MASYNHSSLVAERAVANTHATTFKHTAANFASKSVSEQKVTIPVSILYTCYRVICRGQLEYG